MTSSTDFWQTVADPKTFHILHELADQNDEAFFREVLRPHDEGAVLMGDFVTFNTRVKETSNEHRRLRDVRSELDRALDLLTCVEVWCMLTPDRELAANTHLLPPDTLASPDAAREVRSIFAIPQQLSICGGAFFCCPH
jgi:hypothetical protein